MDTNSANTSGSHCQNETYPESAIPSLGFTYVGLTSVMAVLSVVGAFTIIYTLLTRAELRTKGRMLLVYLSCSDLLLAVSNFMGVIWILVTTDGYSQDITLPLHNSSNTACQVQAALTSTASLASFFWTTFIALNIYLTVVRQNPYLTTRLWTIPHLISWGAPIIICIITFHYKRYGLSPCEPRLWWCWISKEENLLLWQMLSGKLWEIMSYVFVCVLYGRVMYDISSHAKRLESHQRTRERAGSSNQTPLQQRSSGSKAFAYANRKLVFVPLVFICARIWGTLRFILYLIPADWAQDAATCLAPLQGLGDSSQGFLNCMVFIFTTPSIRDKLPCRRFKISFRSSQTDDQANSNEDEMTSSSKESSTRHIVGKLTHSYAKAKPVSYGSTHKSGASSTGAGIAGSTITYSPKPSGNWAIEG